MEEQLNQNIQQQVDEIVDAKKNEIEEFKKKDNKELLDNYASILSTMADLLGIEVYPGIENEDPYSIHYNLNDADKALFVQLQSTVDSIKQAEPSIEQDYEEVDSRINDIRSEMGDIVNEKGEPGIEYYDITSIQDPGKRDRFKELSEKLGEIRKDYPNLFTNEKIVTYAPNGEEIEATDLSEDQEELTDDLRKMSDADLDNNIKATSDNLTRLLNEKERRAKERAEDMVETVEEAQKDEEKAEEEIKQDEEEIKLI